MSTLFESKQSQNRLYQTRPATIARYPMLLSALDSEMNGRGWHQRVHAVRRKIEASKIKEKAKTSDKSCR